MTGLDQYHTIHALASYLEDGSRKRANGTTETKVPGVYVTRYDSISTPPRRLTEALTCLIVQGTEVLHIGNAPLKCPPCSNVIVAQKFPLLRQVLPAEDGRPYIAITIALEATQILSLIQEIGSARIGPGPAFAAVSGIASAHLVDAFFRIVRSTETTMDAAVLAPMIRREIYYHLLTGENGRYVRDLVGHNRQFQRITAGMEWLRQNCDRQVSMQELARFTGMSLSTMHQCFREFTRMTPLEFHKQLRLQRARNLLMVENVDVALVARKVGYKSVSQFSREYRRLFQCSPGQDTKRDHLLRDEEVQQSSAIASSLEQTAK